MEYKRFYAEIKLDSIEKNVDCVRNTVGNDTKIMAIVKADGYGHGAVELASFLKSKVDYFGVATLDEALELRNSGCTHPILILGVTMAEEFEKAVQNDITVAIVDKARAEILNDVANKLGKIANVHIKIDTGMSRIGFDVNERTVEDIEYISKLSNINIEGVFSHFAKADEADKTNAKEQISKFTTLISRLEEKGLNIPVKHISNSAGIMELDCKLDMVRMGIMLYGQYPSGEMDRNYLLYPAMSLYSHITFIKTVKKGTGISYGHTFVTDKETKVATIPVGYADGLPRSLSGKGCVLINNVRCPILGRVCMDQLMVDVTEVDNVSVGDKVTVIGDDLTVDEVSCLAGSFNYEFICGISRRVPRVYTYNNEIIKIKSYLD